ncbi:glycosyl transferase family 2 [Fontibacillus phaseoli]|uniref:Glycosyl transferase family 2 n=1 Tax=Fontibacillus phaseoli TaxID=1416533 RepID=A0A369BB72_9BACL|nr:glycosyl transferase family 2 [Fontibacillus phaseoli]
MIMPRPLRARGKHGVSIITCTKRPYCMRSLFRNYGRQSYGNKELIVILNNKNLKVSEYKKAAANYKNVRIYSLPDHVSLGSCLNYGVGLSKYGFIAKFDDDDYYAPGYLGDSVRTLIKSKADIAGKRSHYMSLSGKKILLHRYNNKANQYVPVVQGATLLVKRHVFGKVRFPDQTRGECVRFCSRSRAKGFKIYSGSPSNFLAMRRSNSKDHTWIVSNRTLLTRHVKVLKVTNKLRFVSSGRS